MKRSFKVGCSPLTGKIYAGNVLKNGTWRGQKHDVTETAPQAVAQHLLHLNVSIEFEYHNGKSYRLQVVEIL